MNKRVLIILMATLLPHFSYGAAETPLLPEVKKALEVPPIDERDMAQNSYVYLLTIDAKDDDYFDIAKKYFITENQWLKEIATSYEKDNPSSAPKWPTYTSILDNKVDGKPYYLPCNANKSSLIDPPCVANILADKPKIMMLINKNIKVLTRFKQVILLPKFQPNIYGSTYGYFYPSQLQLFQAIYAIDEGDINNGLDILQHQIDFSKKIILSSNMPSKKLIRIKLISTYSAISDLLNTYPDLVKEPYLTKVKSLLSPLPDYNINLKDAMSNLRLVSLTDVIISNEKNKQEANRLHLTYNLNDTLNKIYFSYKPFIKFSQLTLQEMRSIYLNNEPIGHSRNCDIFKGRAIGDCDKDNQYGSFEGIDSDHLKKEIYRIFDTYNYLALVNLQLDILSKGLKAEQVPELLSSSGDKALNIITQKPFIWNKENSTISTNYLTSYDKSRNPMSVKIKFNQ